MHEQQQTILYNMCFILPLQVYTYNSCMQLDEYLVFKLHLTLKASARDSPYQDGTEEWVGNFECKMPT